ncbi:hypothetical protein [Roseospirillum parvum]|uniref:Chalcone isomerase-like n=1 Tax=Roseospirillum parvum TaxID=83401 RepID=A0A1G7TR11_9PROT|nr:hypothetical protein [Roseospirillum parvum]SDG36970.1 hypothetical protein SAMN05421742_10157 [Roseospirillum parvum]
MRRLALAALLGLALVGPARAELAGEVSAEAPGEAPALTQQFAEPDYGYRLSYPADWAATRPEPFTLVLSGRLDSAQFHTTISVVNQPAGRPDDPEASAERLLRRYLNEIQAAATKAEVLTTAPFLLRRDGPFLRGTQAVTQFRRAGAWVRQWAVAVGRRDAPVVHLWIYSAPVELFDATRPLAQAVLESWHLTEPPGGGQ